MDHSAKLNACSYCTNNAYDRFKARASSASCFCCEFLFSKSDVSAPLLMILLVHRASHVCSLNLQKWKITPDWVALLDQSISTWKDQVRQVLLMSVVQLCF
ncbi:unnamed protein product [Durusdinium trenchii]|uniref:Uncharacterized protein n=1 Tax=Durusdinium trenchii TaxID=1381693 RepID=A0ABP0K6I1_9DINO